LIEQRLVDTKLYWNVMDDITVECACYVHTAVTCDKNLGERLRIKRVRYIATIAQDFLRRDGRSSDPFLEQYPFGS
jgi:hypothetical protein